nr:hypothetical protein EATA8330_34440 [Enterobacter asburiae]
MVHPGGFEPPTARFVAEYSIQLSYGCIRVLLSEIVNGASGRITRLRLALRAVAKATLSSLVLTINSQTLKQQHRCYLGEYGASGRIRTSDRSVRSRVLYPAELRMHRDLLLYCSIFISLLKQYEVIDGASGRIRTSDRSVRSRVLYPAELRMQNGGEAGIRTPDAAFDRILP